jgi:predicted HTH domain antitoxin
MTVTVEIPDDLAQILTLDGKDPSRSALEAIAIEGYRLGNMSPYQTRQLLGFETRYELDGFLKAHNVWEHSYDLEDLELDRQTLRILEESDHPGA